jgi:hypothetical protein
MNDTWPKIGPDGLPYWELAPGGKKDYGFNWGARYPAGVLTVSSWDAPAFTVTDQGNTGLDTVVWLEATSTVTGRRYKVTNHVTIDGKKDQQSLWIHMKDQ